MWIYREFERPKAEGQKIVNGRLTITNGPLDRMSTKYGMLKTGKRGVDVEGTGGFFRTALLR